MTQPKKPCRVLIFDRHLAVREGLQRLLEKSPFTIKGAVALPDKLVSMVARTSFDVLLMEPNIQGRWDMELIERLLEIKPSIQILIYSESKRVALIAAAYDKGVQGFVSKLSDQQTLISALLRVAGGDTYYSPGIAEQLLNYRSIDQDARNPKRALGESDFRIFIGLAAHRSWTEIAANLGLAEKTVQNRVPRIVLQLGIKREEFRTTAMEYGLIDGGVLVDEA